MKQKVDTYLYHLVMHPGMMTLIMDKVQDLSTSSIWEASWTKAQIYLTQ